jgi:serine/threonine protein kinase
MHLSFLTLFLSSLGIIIEYMDRGSLEFMLDDNLEVSEAVMAAIVFQILWGLGYLHYDNRLVSIVRTSINLRLFHY